MNKYLLHLVLIILVVLGSVKRTLHAQEIELEQLGPADFAFSLRKSQVFQQFRAHIPLVVTDKVYLHMMLRATDKMGLSDTTFSGVVQIKAADSTYSVHFAHGYAHLIIPHRHQSDIVLLATENGISKIVRPIYATWWWLPMVILILAILAFYIRQLVMYK